MPKLELLICRRWMDLPDELKADPRYSADNQHRWLSILAAERRRNIGRYADGGPKAPSKNNREGRWNFWEGHTVEEVLEAVRVGRNVPCRMATPRVGALRATRSIFFTGRGRASMTPTPLSGRTPPPQPVANEEEGPKMERVLAESLETFELDEFGRWPSFFKALRDLVMEIGRAHV